MPSSFTDTCSKYLNKSFETWCSEKGIEQRFSAPRTPNQNGKAERLNQSLNNTVRSMLVQYDLPKQLWSQALLYASDLHN
jgi:transposase InsO family protein